MENKIVKQFIDFYDLNNKHIKSNYLDEIKKIKNTDDFKKVMTELETQLQYKSSEEIEYNKNKVSNAIIIDSISQSMEYLDFEKETFTKLLTFLKNNPILKKLENNEDEYNKKFLEELFKVIMSLHHNFINIFKFLPIFSIANNPYDFIDNKELLKTIDKNLYDKISRRIEILFKSSMSKILFHKDCLEIIKVENKYYYIKNVDDENLDKTNIEDLEIKQFPFICS